MQFAIASLDGRLGADEGVLSRLPAVVVSPGHEGHQLVGLLHVVPVKSRAQLSALSTGVVGLTYLVI